MSRGFAEVCGICQLNLCSLEAAGASPILVKVLRVATKWQLKVGGIHVEERGYVS